MKLHVACSANIWQCLDASGARRPGQNALHALLRGQHEAPEEVPHRSDTQWHRSPRTALKTVRRRGAGGGSVFF
jgi:hypothetical protein